MTARNDLERAIADRIGVPEQHCHEAPLALAALFDPANRAALVAALIDVGVLRQPRRAWAAGIASSGAIGYWADSEWAAGGIAPVYVVARVAPLSTPEDSP